VYTRPASAFLILAALSGCQAGGSGGATNVSGPPPTTVSGVPPAAVSACLKRADSFWSAAPGTSVVNGAQQADSAVVGNWQLLMGTGNNRSTCTVNPIGQVIDMSPS
jgi:hypothetical protein